MEEFMRTQIGVSETRTRFTSWICIGLMTLVVGCGSGSNTPTTEPAPAAPVITVQPNAQSVILGGNVTFSVTATGRPAPGYQWEKNGKEIMGATGASLQVNGVELTDEGATFDVIVHNALSYVKSEPAALHVHNTPGNFLVTFVPSSPNLGSVSGAWIQSVVPGGEASAVQVYAAKGCKFENWTCDDGSSSTANPLTVTAVEKDLIYTANFEGSAVGCRAADIPGHDNAGNAVKLSDDSGSVIVLNISAGWSDVCEGYALDMETLYNKFSARGLKVVTVLSENRLGKSPSQAELQSWVSTYGLTCKVQNDTSSYAPASGVAESLYVSYLNLGFPCIVVIDKNFVVQYIAAGYSRPQVEAKLEELLGK